MNKYFDEKKWEEIIGRPDWYLILLKEFKDLEKKANESGDLDISQEIKEGIYNFFEKKLEENKVFLGRDGENWDKDRSEIDTIIIHHSKNDKGDLSISRLNAMHLLRLYATYYANPYYENEKHIKGKPIFSSHFKNERQVFYAYHWLIRKDGSIERLLEDNEIGWHAGNWDINKRSIAICIDDNLEDRSPSENIIESVLKIIKGNYSQIKKENIFGHREINERTTCPGNLFLSRWKDEIINNL